MRRNTLWMFAAVALVCASAEAGLRYEYREDTSTENRIDARNMTARAVLEGERGRIDILSGNRYEPGSYILRDGDVRVFFVHPDRKQYSEVAIPKGSARENAQRLSITNPKITFEELEDGPVIAGYPTRHYRMTTSYELAITLGTMVVRQKVEATIDKWTTTAFDHIVNKYLDDSQLLTGKPDVDELIQAEASKFKGLPLKLRSVTKTVPMQQAKDSKLKLPPSRQRIRDMEVTKIEEAKIAPELFTIPAGFKPASDAAPSTAAHYLTMEPATD